MTESLNDDCRGDANADTTTTADHSTANNANIQTASDGKNPSVELAPDSEVDPKSLYNDGVMDLPTTGYCVSGISGKFPKADSVAEYQYMLDNGLDMVMDEDDTRFDCRLWGLPPRAGRMKNLQNFDYQFFGYTLDEANVTDHQLRILYEVVYESILDAGVNPSTLRGTKTGVFFGCHMSEYEREMEKKDMEIPHGYYLCYATKIAGFLGVKGECGTYDAACASAFVAMHAAMTSLAAGIIDSAIVCAANVPISPIASFVFYQMQMLSPTGYSRFLDAAADGYVKSESVVSCFIQRETLAKRNYCSILNCMTSVDGYKKEGITYPSDATQEALMRSTKDAIGLKSNHIQYLEAHGTGTPAGDPQEARSIANVYADMDGSSPNNKTGDKRTVGPLLVGSVKTNMGHSEGASGLCSLIKAILMLENEVIYKNLHFTKPNPNIDSLKTGQLKIVTEKMNLHGKVIPLSCYGFGGSNVHVIARANGREYIEPISTLPTFDSRIDNLPEHLRLVVMFGRDEVILNNIFDKLLKTNNCLTEDFLALVDSLNATKIDRLMTARGYMVVNMLTKQQVYRSISLINPDEFSPANKTKIQVENGSAVAMFDLYPKPSLQESASVKCRLSFNECSSNDAENLRRSARAWARISPDFKNCLGRLSHHLSMAENPSLKKMNLFSMLLNPDNNFSPKTKAEIIIASIGFELAFVCFARHFFGEREAEKDEWLHSATCVESSLVSSLGCAFAKRLIDEDTALNIAAEFALLQDTNAHNVTKQKFVEIVTKHIGQEEAKKLIDNAVDKPASLEYELPRVPVINVGTIKSTETQHGLHINTIAGRKQLNVHNDSGLEAISQCTDSLDLLGCLTALGDLYKSGFVFDLSKFYYWPLVQASENDLKFPVRRQTPSLSSIFEWDHTTPIYVPRYPECFSKSSAKSELPVDTILEDTKYLLDHAIEGRVLFPATGYLFYIWRTFCFVKNKIYDACYHKLEHMLVPVEMTDVRLMRAVILSDKPTQLYIHYEEGTGFFLIKEGGTVVCEGYARSPKQPGLLYNHIRDHMKSNLESRRKAGDEQANIKLSSDDVYKLFRVCGYDYGPDFRNIVEATADGTWCNIKYNDHFVALTDSILQSIFLAILNYAPVGGLFLPTRFDYIRYDPEVILKKLRACNHLFDVSDKRLDTQERREAIQKLMSREEEPKTEDKTEEDEAEKNKSKPIDCFFETYCDSITGIIVTDGIEMRGITASPAPRRVTNNDALLESYQFVPDFEDPVEDEPLTQQKTDVERYVQICDSLAIEIVSKLEGKLNDKLGIEQYSTKMNGSRRNVDEIETYMKLNLASRYQDMCTEATNMTAANDEDAGEDENKKNEENKYDVQKNGQRILATVLDELYYRASNSKKIVNCDSIIEANKDALAGDMIQVSCFKERYMRPIIETVLENVCFKKGANRLRALEINADDILLKSHIDQLLFLAAGDSKVTNDYKIAHPNPEKLLSKKLIDNISITQKMEDLNSVLKAQGKESRDLIIMKDVSCYCLSQLKVEQNGLSKTMELLNQALAVNGFVLVCMRRKLTLAEQTILSLSSKSTIIDDGESIVNGHSGKGGFDKINALIESRCRLLLREAANNKLDLVAHKSDTTGCALFLFHKKSEAKVESEAEVKDETRITKMTSKDVSKSESDTTVTLHVTTSSAGKIDEWLKILRGVFKPEEKKEEKEDEAKEKTPEQIEAERKKKENEVPRVEADVVWLCGAVTKNDPPTGLIGMMQALRRELGSKKLRCFVDGYSFRDFESDEDIRLSDFQNSGMFKEAKKRDFLWNIIDESGRLGSYRHFTVNDYLNYDSCLCSSVANSTGNPDSIVHAQDLRSDDLLNGTAAKQQIVPSYINYATKGDLSSFTWFQTRTRNLTPDTEVIQVAYSSLNFRDVMFATGKLGLDSIPIHLAMNDCILGLEFSGVLLSKNNERPKRVAGMAAGYTLSNFIMAGKNSIYFELPDYMSLQDAATIPVVYMTTIMSLVNRAKALKGESILIHAGTGGVGQAAIRIAHHLGLEIFTTVGTAEKRKFILDEFAGIIQDDHILNSRDTTFENDIMRMTKGLGVDIVLNSLADDKLMASIRCLREGGRFCEIGKYDLAVNTKLELLMLERNQTFHGILLDKFFDVDKTVKFSKSIDEIYGILRDGITKGYVKPIKTHLFQRNEIEDAFRFMAAGKHTGKVMIEICKEADLLASKIPVPRSIPTFELDSNKGYIITGGLGGFGLELVKWLVLKGARYLTITSRSGVRTGYQRDTIYRLINRDKASINVVTEKMADASNKDGADELIKIATKDCPSNKLGGIFHLAMVLKDSLLENLTTQDFETVCKPKISICHSLDKATRALEHQPDFFVVFSSVTSGKGNAGQSNYAYANSSTERICEERRRDGMHGLAIQWGAIGDVGVAFENLGGNDIVIGGTVPQRMPSCFATLNQLLASPFSVCLSVLPVNRGKAGAVDPKSDLVGAVLRVLGIKDRSKVDPKTSLGELGLDSLMAVEIRQYIEREYDISMNIQEIRALTIEKIQEIGDSGQKPKVKSDTESQEGEVKSDSKVIEAQSYGIKLDRNQPSNTKDHNATKTAADSKFKLHQSMGAFVPQLIIPRSVIRNLNNHHVSSQPLFFIPPIHGRFQHLEMLAKNIKRPCIGMNWNNDLAHCKTASKAVKIHLETLHNYVRENNMDKLTVDLVGYSFGSIVAFELINKLQKTIKSRKDSRLIPGKLTILDSSPKFLEISNKILVKLQLGLSDDADSQDEEIIGSSLSEKLDAMIIAFCGAILKDRIPGLADDKARLYTIFQELKSEIEKTDIDMKFDVASSSLVELLNEDDINPDDVSLAMEAFCRRYQIMQSYKCIDKIDGPCTLIRASAISVECEEIKEDYNMSEIVEGQVDMHIFEGDHETFIENNHEAIAKLIA